MSARAAVPIAPPAKPKIVVPPRKLQAGDIALTIYETGKVLPSLPPASL